MVFHNVQDYRSDAMAKRDVPMLSMAQPTTLRSSMPAPSAWAWHPADPTPRRPALSRQTTLSAPGGAGLAVLWYAPRIASAVTSGCNCRDAMSDNTCDAIQPMALSAQVI